MLTTISGFDGPMANVYVGPEAKQWTIHLEMFARYSPLFRHFCNQAKNKRAAQVADHQQPTEAQDGTAKEGAPAADMSSTEPANEGTSTPSKKARLSDTFTIEIRQPQWRPAVFGLLVHWVYASDLLRTSSFPKGRRGLEAPKVMDFIDLHIMGLELKMTSLCNAAIGEIYDQLKPVEGKAPRHPKPVEILRVFKNTPADSGLRKLMTVHALLYIFSERRNKHLGLPEGWEPLVKSSSEVGWALLSMVSTVRKLARPRCMFRSRC